MLAVLFLFIVTAAIHISGVTVFLGFGPLNEVYTFTYLTPADVPFYDPTITFSNQMMRFGFDWFLDMFVIVDLAVPVAILLGLVLILLGYEGAGDFGIYYIAFDAVYAVIRAIWRFFIFGWCTQYGQICRNPNPLESTNNWSFNNNPTWETVFLYCILYLPWIVFWFMLAWFLLKSGEISRKEAVETETRVILDKVYKREEQGPLVNRTQKPVTSRHKVE